MTNFNSLLIASLFTVSSAFAETGADALLKASGPQTPAAGAAAQPGYVSPSLFAMDEIKLNTPIARQVFSDWMAAPTSQYELNAWVKAFYKEQFEPVAHVWGVMSAKLPANLENTGRAIYLYSLYRLGVPQTFFNQWMSALNSASFASSKAALALEETLAPEFDEWYLSHTIQTSTDQESLIQRLGAARSSVFTSLAASTFLRKGEAGAELLPKLPLNSKFRPLLSQTAAVALAKRGDLSNAARVLKTYYEPWLVTTKDPRKLAVYYLQIARLLYQAGSLDGAVVYYEKVPTGMPEFLTAREELAWCWLRMGDAAKLRGNLETLTSKVLDDHFQPEAYLVRAVSNLKLCFYGEVEKDFANFLKENREWAKTIQTNVQAAEPKSPRVADLFSERATTAIGERETEIAALKNFSNRSVGAVLPAVGPQKHWTQAVEQGIRDLENAKKARAAEYRRQWKNDQTTLAEAIRKMQFVKVELLSQVALAKDTDQVALTASSTTQKLNDASETKKVVAEGDMVFPFDGVVWPDELFKLRARTVGRCLGQY